jgi:signal transduction histidine kinase/CheY-like chemotaxis protein
MRRVLIIVYSALLLILLANYIYYNDLYKKQIDYIFELLDRQTQIVGLEVDSTNNGFVSELTEISFPQDSKSQDMSRFFDKTAPQIKFTATEALKNFYSKYNSFVIKIRVYDNNFNEYTLAKDAVKNVWLESEFISFNQKEVERMERLKQTGNEFSYYSTILRNGIPTGNIVVTVDYRKYLMNLFSKYHLKENQWQWVLSDSGKIIFDNYPSKIEYSQVGKIAAALAMGSVSRETHTATVNGKSFEIISSYYSTQLLTRDIGLVFSASTTFFQKYIIRNSIFIVIGTLFIIQLIIMVFIWYIRKQKSEMTRLTGSEQMLIRLIEEMPVGVIIYNGNREILKANKIAAGFYSFEHESDMLGKIFPSTTLSEDNDYFSKHLGGAFSPDQFVIIKKEIGEVILYRSSIPFKFLGEEASLEILIDITMLESARKEEARANVAKSEFLARMSYEIRTPLNGIIGMADLLNKHELSEEVKDVVSLLRRSTEVLLGIINDILDFSKIESGKMILDETPFNIREEIFFAIDLAKTQISEKEVNVVSSIDSNIPETIIGDSFRLRQILANIINQSISNTVKGEIHVKCRLKETKSGIITLLFEILDTGKNFDKATLKKVYGDYVDSDTVAFLSSDESGFGTIIARQLVEMMGGELSASSPSGLSGMQGTRVAFTIKTYSNERIHKGLSFPDIKSIEQVRTLVITGSHGRDEDFISLLHKLGLKPAVTTFQKTTINQIKANLSLPQDRYKLIIIVDDEDFDGFEAARLLWENKLSEGFIMMMISSNDRKGNYLKCINMGIDHYLVKPVDRNDLYQEITGSFIFIENTSKTGEIENVNKDLQLLVVEDNRMNQTIIVKMLATLGYRSDVAEDGFEGYHMARTKKYDLIFMDLVMPEMDGFESTRKIIEFDKTNLIVAFTADNMPETRRKAELSGIKEFISKPVRLDDLKRLFAKYFNK